MKFRVLKSSKHGGVVFILVGINLRLHLNSTMRITFVLDTSGSMNQASDGISLIDSAKNAVSIM